METSDSRRSVLSSFGMPIAILIAAVMISGTILYSSDSQQTALLPGAQEPEVIATPVEDLAALAGSAPMLGRSDAPVTIVEFSDFQCLFCRRFFEDTYAQLKSEYIDTGKVRLLFRDFPLPFHDAATPTAIAARCANDQGKFWEFHDTVFVEQAKLGTGTVEYGVPELKKWGASIGLNATTFNQCIDSKRYEDAVVADTEAGSGFGVSGTPSFFINGKLLVGAQPFSSFKQLIDAELQ